MLFLFNDKHILKSQETIQMVDEKTDLGLQCDETRQTLSDIRCSFARICKNKLYCFFAPNTFSKPNPEESVVIMR